MKYFVDEKERKGTCYHEFYKGKWDRKTFWKKDSLLIHDDIMFENKGFIEALVQVVPTYDSCKETEISQEDWVKIGEILSKSAEKGMELYREANEWLEEVFLEHKCFTILGL